MAPGFILENLDEAFQHEVFEMPKKEGKIHNAVIENMLSWHHSGFHVYIGDRIEPDDIIPRIIPNETSSKKARQSRARLIQKIYEVDPLCCPKCQGSMEIISYFY